MYFIFHFLDLNNFQFPLANLPNTLILSSSAKYPFGRVPSICCRRIFLRKYQTMPSNENVTQIKVVCFCNRRLL